MAEIPLEIQEQLDTLAAKRYNGLRKRLARPKLVDLGTIPHSLKDIQEVYCEAYKNGFVCEYCKRQLVFKSIFPYWEAASLDHKRPLMKGGSGEKTNLAVCCHRCNVIKGTLDAEEYLWVLESLKLRGAPELMEKVLSDWFNFWVAMKQDREEFEKRGDKI